MAHALNLLFQDWGAAPSISCVVADAQNIVKFISTPLAPFQKHASISSQGLNLLTLATTQFATYFFDVKQTLKQIVINMD
jgi:hypothetical protein